MQENRQIRLWRNPLHIQLHQLDGPSCPRMTVLGGRLATYRSGVARAVRKASHRCEAAGPIQGQARLVRSLQVRPVVWRQRFARSIWTRSIDVPKSTGQADGGASSQAEVTNL